MIRGNLINLGILLVLLNGCAASTETEVAEPQLRVSENKRHLEYRDGRPFFWLGGTSWGMSEWLTREDVIHYLDDRQAKEFSLVQVCLFWGKREEDPVKFTLNPPNAYGFKAFEEVSGMPDPERPAVVEGGSPTEPNDYWDHVDFIIKEVAQRDMMVALLPVWGRRYVNASHGAHAQPFFTLESMKSYGEFLGSRYQAYDHIIWVLGGDVKADGEGDYLPHYRAMAEGILTGVTDKKVAWNAPSPLWDQVLMTYHPDGAPFLNSSTWFHTDPWLDFNMIETFKNRESVYEAVAIDYGLENPIKPTVMGEPDYEGVKPNLVTAGVHMRRQAFHSFFAGASGFTYGGKFDAKGNGPLWSPYKGWKNMLDMEGARTMKQVKKFCLENGWPYWTPDNSLLAADTIKGELQKVAVQDRANNSYYIYFPDSSQVSINVIETETRNFSTKWYNPQTGNYSDEQSGKPDQGQLDIILPQGWEDAVLIINYN
ncbi:MAG: DUF4038 domain-containing protein [Bacteroidota bacterium]